MFCSFTSNETSSFLGCSEGTFEGRKNNNKKTSRRGEQWRGCYLHLLLEGSHS